jgi:hypothetical protein
MGDDPRGIRAGPGRPTRSHVNELGVGVNLLRARRRGLDHLTVRPLLKASQVAGSKVMEEAVLVGRPGSQLLKEADGIRADLIVVASPGHGAVIRALGSVSDQVVRTHRPLLRSYRPGCVILLQRRIQSANPVAMLPRGCSSARTQTSAVRSTDSMRASETRASNRAGITRRSTSAIRVGAHPNDRTRSFAGRSKRSPNSVRAQCQDGRSEGGSTA